jgi:hypothetical protein
MGTRMASFPERASRLVHHRRRVAYCEYLGRPGTERSGGTLIPLRDRNSSLWSRRALLRPFRARPSLHSLKSLPSTNDCEGQERTTFGLGGDLCILERQKNTPAYVSCIFIRRVLGLQQLGCSAKITQGATRWNLDDLGGLRGRLGL